MTGAIYGPVEAETWDAILAVVKYELLHDDPRTAEFNLLSRGAVRALRGMAPSDLVEFISSAMVLSLRIGNIPEDGGDYKFGTLVAAARQGMMREAPEPAADGQPSSTPHHRRHLEVV